MSFSTLTVIRPVRFVLVVSPSKSVALTCTYWPKLVIAKVALSPDPVG